ncbi:AraC family transcriptional regulator [Salmonella enterica]|uniref:AraC family transcriptional regulator n=1 Tax=Salmonella enterica TaxID=28901 RepID=UPI000BA09956|nr:AraC family transcriptional regulator [Salmonella enterica]EBV7253171.1 helix-turn-helix domain-containing protein [Salmonella enterica subsp. enterica serovar Pomona]EGA8870299.1 AraC family transcriptional regulator [Salmonella enterica subsp. enterica serovar Oranienburg]EHM1179209.1 AraC family transcriptional regulator [Salmonella enterica subsp. enterica serovar Urbana]EAW7736123.1 AraC family transcriptional regulator [Salmonella enterica]EEJ1803855.1 AraC family transcriptional regu
MILYTKKTCAIVLTEKTTQVKINDLEPITIPENHLVLLSGRDNLYFSSLNTNLVVHIGHDVILDYLNSIKCDLIGFTHRVKRNSLPPIFTCFNKTPEIFRSAALYSQNEIDEFCDSQRTRFLIFSVLSNFLIHSEFILYLIDINRIRVSDNVYHLINSNLKFNWNLNIVAKSLCLSSSLLKKRLKDENTSYSKILTNCRMYYATKLLQTAGININQVSDLCGYNNSSYFISVFKSFYGITPCRFLKNITHR